jgi:diphthamide synthase (EF-2-diphthine--ammonia ligase)
MGRLSGGGSSYAVYCGNGVYVGAVALDAEKSIVVEVAPECGAAVVSRSSALGMLHAVRRLGFSAWIVRAGVSA